MADAGFDWEQLFCSAFSSYRRWHCLHSGDGQRGTLSSLNSVCSLRVGTKSPQTPAVPRPVLLASEERDAAEGVKQNGTGDKTEHAAGPALTGPVAPFITLTVEVTANAKDCWKIHLFILPHRQSQIREYKFTLTNAAARLTCTHNFFKVEWGF